MWPPLGAGDWLVTVDCRIDIIPPCVFMLVNKWYMHGQSASEDLHPFLYYIIYVLV